MSPMSSASGAMDSGPASTTGSLTRRGLLVGAGGTAFGLAVVGSLLTGGEVHAADAYTALRDRWRNLITGADRVDRSLPEFVAALDRLDGGIDTVRGLIDRGSARTRVFTDMPLNQTTDSSMIANTYARLRQIAYGWFTPGSRHHGSAAVLADVLAGLDTANRVTYHAGRAEFDNWYHWEIGAARPLADCLVLLDEQLPATARSRYVDALRHFVPDPHYMMIRSPEPSTGANRVDLCQVAMVEGIASRSSARIARAAAGLPPVCRYVDSGDGFYADGSFIQHHDVAYTGTYGLGLLTGLSRLLTLLAGSAWEITDPAVGNLVDAVDRAFAPVIHDGRMMSFVCGRAVCRASHPEQRLGKEAVGSILQLAAGGVADAATVRRWRGLCRGWLDRDTARGPYDWADVSRTALVSGLLRDTTVAATPEPDTSVVFRNMARAVHRRAGWAFAVSMCDHRIARYESINGENLKGFHTGAGMTYLYDGDDTQYTDGFWPTVDPYRLAGTTVEKRALPDAAAQAPPSSRWSGGPVLAGRYSAVGMTLQGGTGDLRGKKSWFCFDEYVFAMGSMITSSSGYRVETVIENRNLHATGVNPVTVDGVVWPYQLGATRTWAGARWVHLDGVAGYVFPAPLPVTAARTARTGRYRDIATAGSTDPITRRYLTLWLDHGHDPVDAQYSYLYIPRATVARTRELSEHRDVTIVSSNTRCHMVRQPHTGITMANFWAAPYADGGISVSKVCGVIVREHGGKLTIAVAEPYRSGNVVRVTVTPTLSGYHLVSKDSAVTVVSVGTSIVLDVAPGTFGRTYTAEFARTA